MKKIMILICLMIVLLITSCSNNKDNSQNNPIAAEEITPTSSKYDDEIINGYLKLLANYEIKYTTFNSYTNITNYVGYIPVNLDIFDIKQNLVPSYYTSTRPGIKRDIIKYIVIHDTGNNASSATAAKHTTYLNSNPGVSWHFVIDENTIIQNIPLNEVAYHAGDGLNKSTWSKYGTTYPGGGNAYGIGIETCVNEGSNYYKTLAKTSYLCAKILNEYQLTINDIKPHQFFTGKNCPRALLESNYYNTFLSIVEIYQYYLKYMTSYQIEISTSDNVTSEGYIIKKQNQYKINMNISNNKTTRNYHLLFK